MNVPASTLNPDVAPAEPEWVAPRDLTAERALEACLQWLRLRLERLAKGEPPDTDEKIDQAAQAEVEGVRSSTAPGRQPEARPGCIGIFLPRAWRSAPASTPPSDGLAIARATAERRPLIDRPDNALEEAAIAMERALEAHPRPPLTRLVEAFRLSRHERNTLLLAAAPEIDPGLGKQIAAAAKACDLGDEPRPTFGLALELFRDWGVLDNEGPLRRLKFLDVHQPSGQSLVSATIRADERIVHFLKGINRLDDLLDLWLNYVPPPEPSVSLPPSQARVAHLMLRTINSGGDSTFIQLLGNDGASKLLVTGHVANECDRTLYHLKADALPTRLSDIVDFARVWERDSRLLRLALLIDARDLPPEASAAALQALERLLERLHGGVVVLDTAEPRSFPRQPALSIDVNRPLPLEQRAAWLRELESIPRCDVERKPDSDRYACDPPRPDTRDQMIARMLASQFNLNISTIHAVARGVAAESYGREIDFGELYVKLWCACLSVARPRLDALARRLEPAPRGVDVILPEPGCELLAQIVSQVKNRGRVLDDWGFRRLLARGEGLCVLFAGESGTGKTLAAEVLARRLHLNLYRVDLSAVVSKFIGETEKNLRRLFDAAEDGGVILFFDEADALFGRRTEVKDSHDRYANLEINYLLQRIEAFRGLAILATNLKSQIDTAFMRRLRFVVDFPFPGPPERKQIWQQWFPRPDRSLADLWKEWFPKYVEGGTPAPFDPWDWLGKLVFNGGSIKTIAINGAYVAAADPGSADPRTSGITLAHVLTAARQEYVKQAQDVPREVQGPSGSDPSKIVLVFPPLAPAERTLVWEQWFPRPDVDLPSLWKRWFPRYAHTGHPVPFDPWEWLSTLDFNRGAINLVARRSAESTRVGDCPPGITLAHILAAARQEFLAECRHVPEAVQGPPGCEASAIILLPAKGVAS